MITKIKITNIKGFGTDHNELDVQLSESRINILVAPNGFGKTSLTTAFKCVSENGKRLVVHKDLMYQKNENLHPVLRLEENNVKYVADRSKNEIADKFNCQIINGLLKADTKSVKIGSYTNTTAILAIDEVILGTIPQNPQKAYKLATIRSNFGEKGKMLHDISPLFENVNLLDSILGLNDVFEKFKAKKRDKIVEDVICNINEAKANIKKIKANVDLSFIQADGYYQTFATNLKQYYSNFSDWEIFSAFYQFKYMFEQHKDWLSKQINYLKYVQFKKKLDKNLKDFNSSWKTDLKSVGEKGVLKVKFLKADELSNGQRDVMSFIVQLMNVRNKLKSKKKNIVIIDEIFDYMDDANLTAAQYYLTKYLEINKGNIYIIILSHLDPVFFKNYIFSPKKINVCYLSKQTINVSESMKAFICFRNNLNKEDKSDKQIYDDLSTFFFHYNPSNKDLTAVVKPQKNLRTTWFKDDNLKVYLVDELNKYLSDSNDYDPYSVCLAIRIRVEKLAYDKLKKETDKQSFLGEYKTKDRLSKAEDLGASIPDSFYVMGAIYNDAEHLHDNENDKKCIYKLCNKVIKNIIKEFFYYKGSPITIDDLK